ncbi:MAG: sulfatase [Opitutales bacterium]|nr:sulfatase [Opitutales bacterium]
MNRFSIVLLALLSSLPPTLIKAASKMNVVFFLVDDFGYHDISATGSPLYETPRIDELAESGVLLTQAHSAYPRCVPSRFAMISGVHPSRAASVGESPGNMSPDRVTIAEALKEQGYATFFAGKWHLGKEAARHPQGQGFDINIAGGSAGAPGSYFPPYDNSKKLTGPETLQAPEGEYLTDRLTTETVQFIEAKREDPFFVYLSHYAVHTPIQGKANKTARYEKKIHSIDYEGSEYNIGADGRELRHQNNPRYAAMVESVDESLGRILDTLKRLKIEDKTIVILTSDHGGLSNSGPESKRELATSNLPLRAGKGHIYQGGLRVPVIVHWPGVTKSGSRTDFPITGMDYYPTILEMLELPLRPDDHIDGVSFVPGLKGKQNFNSKRAFFWYSDAGRRDSTGDLNAAAIRRGPYKLLQFFNEDRLELYNLKTDPGETQNLVLRKAELRDSLLAELLDWKQAMKVRDKEQ